MLSSEHEKCLKTLTKQDDISPKEVLKHVFYTVYDLYLEEQLVY